MTAHIVEIIGWQGDLNIFEKEFTLIIKVQENLPHIHNAFILFN